MNSQQSKQLSRSQSKKRKMVPRIKILLTNPIQSNIPRLPTHDVYDLKEIMLNEIHESCLPGREFAKLHRISIGITSSMRQIGQRKASCVLISQTLRPKFVIEQIGYYATQKRSSTAVFVVANFDQISVKVFGMKALVMTLPSTAPGKIGEWIAKRTKFCMKKSDFSEPYNPNDPYAKIKRNLDLNQFYCPRETGRSFIPPNVIKCEKVDDKNDMFRVNRNRKIFGMSEFEKKKQLPKIVYEEWDEDFEFLGYNPLKSRYCYRNMHRRLKKRPKNAK